MDIEECKYSSYRINDNNDMGNTGNMDNKTGNMGNMCNNMVRAGNMDSDMGHLDDSFGTDVSNMGNIMGNINSNTKHRTTSFTTDTTLSTNADLTSTTIKDLDENSYLLKALRSEGVSSLASYLVNKIGEFNYVVCTNCFIKQNIEVTSPPPIH
jgi:hypothetical protein